MNRELIACFVKHGIRAPWHKSSVCPKGALHLGLGNRMTDFKHKMTQTKVCSMVAQKRRHGILSIQKSPFGHYFLHDLFHLRDRSLHYAPK